MAQQSRERLKGWFRKGACPTEAQFADLIDSMTHAGDRFPITRTEGLAEALNGKVGRGELGTLRRLLDDFRGFGALVFDGTDREARAIEPGSPGRIALLAAVHAGAFRVVFNVPDGIFLLELALAEGYRYYRYWPETGGTFGTALAASTDYKTGRLYMTTEGGFAAFYSWSGKGEPRPLGGLGAVGEALAGSGALTPGVRVEHKGGSARIVIASVGPDGSAGEISASIGAVGNKAGLMLPEHAEAITDLGRRLGLLETTGGGSPGGECGCAAIAEEEIEALFDGDTEPDGPADAERITVGELDDLIDDGVAQTPVVSPPGEDRLGEEEIDTLIGSIF